MARSFLTAINLNKNELQNAVVQNLASAPTSPVKGQLYMDSVGNILYWYNGTGWVAAQGGAGAVPATTVTTQAVGDAAVVGTATTYAREDHKHGRESFGTITTAFTFGATKTDGVATTLARSDHAHGTPPQPYLNTLTATGDVAVGGWKLTNVGTPVSGSDATNKTYVDNAIAGLSWKTACECATTGNITLSGLQTIDGVGPGIGPVLVKNQTNAAENGIYNHVGGAWTRRSDMDSSLEIPGAAVWVNRGTVNADTAWVVTTDSGGFSLGTTPITWVKFGGGQAYTAGAGLTLAGNQFDRAALTGDVMAIAGSNLTAIQNGVVSNAKLANMPSFTLKGNPGGSAGPPQDLTQADVMSTFGLVRKQTFTCSAGATTVIGHFWSTQQILVEVYRTATPFDTVDCDIERTDGNNVTVRFASPLPAAGDYTILLVG